MSQRAICWCPLCQLERRIIARLESEESTDWFLGLTKRIQSLGPFASIADLLSFVHNAGHDTEKRHACDGVYVALLRELSSVENVELLQAALLRMLAPGLHRELRGLMISFPGINRDDLTQELFTNCFQIMRSSGILRKTSYVSASIIEWTKRDTIRWAIRQYREADREETGIVIDLVEARDSKSFEAEIHLRHLLDKSVLDELISSDDVDLLRAYEIEGRTGQELGKREGLDRKALSHRVRRTLQRLNRALQKSAKPAKQNPRKPLD